MNFFIRTNFGNEDSFVVEIKQEASSNYRDFIVLKLKDDKLEMCFITKINKIGFRDFLIAFEKIEEYQIIFGDTKHKDILRKIYPIGHFQEKYCAKYCKQFNDCCEDFKSSGLLEKINQTIDELNEFIKNNIEID